MIGLDKAGNTALHWAGRGGHAQVVELLLTKKPANKMGDTSLHLAAWGGGPDVMGLLLAQDGIQFGIKNCDGKTASQLCRNDQAAATLLQFGGGVSNPAGDADYEDDD
ncbi:osteoclast-stimulating factor [Cladochytrium replicatum]|nr:osteoclast-stimulating factor [Cladochytrium replicatum]